MKLLTCLTNPLILQLIYTSSGSSMLSFISRTLESRVSTTKLKTLTKIFVLHLCRSSIYKTTSPCVTALNDSYDNAPSSFNCLHSEFSVSKLKTFIKRSEDFSPSAKFRADLKLLIQLFLSIILVFHFSRGQKNFSV